MSKLNFKEEILEATKGDTVIAFRFNGQYPSYGSENDIPTELVGKCITLEEALVYCDYIHDNSYGGQECHDITMWSDSLVYFIHEYDGSTWIESVDRNPVNQECERKGP